jgi:2-polyprenyl-6-methoxyphenol hydroxylase-like FAD-dependent oxidoreductase
VALRAVVVGGGIGGTAAAAALAQAGIDVRVYEQAQQLAEVGADLLAPLAARLPPGGTGRRGSGSAHGATAPAMTAPAAG